MRKIFLPLLLVALSPVAHSEGVQEVEIDAPLSGWHPAEGEDASFSQSINYPASSVNMADDQNISAQIRGKIKNYAAAGKVQQGRLVVNGASMPQRIESDGSFARPYIFTEGSNSVQVISPDGQSRQKMQFYSTPGNQSAITNVSNVSNMAKISGSGSHRLTKRVIKRDMRPIINHPVAYSDRRRLQTELLFWHARWLNHTRRQFR
ncbi:DUF2135 family protein, function uncharacterised [Escherichia coli]|nr:DUF2135 family protein, function uncharacterised [Escherichia coli]